MPKARTARPVEYQAPFDTEGNLLHFPGYGGSPQWRPVEPFHATMRVERTQRGRSAAYFIWTDQDGRTFPMFISDLLELLLDRDVASGQVTGWWAVRKRGENFGIRIAEAPAPAAPT